VDHALGRLAGPARAGAEPEPRSVPVRSSRQLSPQRANSRRTVTDSPNEIEGSVLRVVFAAPDGSFAVVRLEVAGRDQPVTVVGALAEAQPGEHLKLQGTWEHHPQHGEQLRVTRAVVELPRTAEGVQRYLEGLKGIGPELARRLVAAFGVSAVEVLE